MLNQDMLIKKHVHPTTMLNQDMLIKKHVHPTLCVFTRQTRHTYIAEDTRHKRHSRRLYLVLQKTL